MARVFEAHAPNFLSPAGGEVASDGASRHRSRVRGIKRSVVTSSTQYAPPFRFPLSLALSP